MRIHIHLGKNFKRDVFTSFFAVIFLLVFIPISTYTYFANDISSPQRILNKQDTGLILYDNKGEVFYKFYEAKTTTYIPFSEIPEHVKQALLVAEDKGFYNHKGFSIQSIVAALIANIRKRDLAYGGSTITQQLVKNTLLTSKKKLLRKYQEIVLAQEIERKYSKNKILEMYANSVYFGEGAFGIENAAQTYFGKSAKMLTVSEASLLAGLIKAPSYLSPISGNKKASLDRKNQILENLFEEGYLTIDQKEMARNIVLAIDEPRHPFEYKAPHFALMVRDELINKYGEEKIARSGFRVYTTLDIRLQKQTEQAVRNQVEKLALSQVSNGAAVVIDPTNGHIKALVGSIDWYDNSFGKFNVALAKRQPGSAFKPIIYAAALEKNIITPATVLKDQPVSYPTIQGLYRPQNYDNKFRGNVLARRALANSLNVPSVEVMVKLGIPNGIEMARRLGITTLQGPSQYGPSLVLGSGEVKLLELTNAYAVFANRGYRNNPTTITQIKDKLEQSIYTYKPENKKVLDEQYAYLISSILSDKKARFEIFGSLLDIPYTAAVKTGTTENYKDSLTIGYSPGIAVGVWVGNNNGASMNQIAGSLGAAPIWKKIMISALEEKGDEAFIKPNSIIAKTICVFGKTASQSAVLMEYFANGTEPNYPCVLPTPAVNSAIVNEIPKNSAQANEQEIIESRNRGKKRGKNTN